MYVFVFILEKKKKHLAGLQKLSSALFNLFYESIDASCLIYIFFNIVKTILLFLYFSNLSYENTFIQAMALIIVSN